MPIALAVTFMATVLAGTLAASRTEAQALHYRSIPIGERAMGLGGAYTGIADDPSATYYNPAGMMTGGRFQLLGSLASLVFTRRTVENAFDSPNVEADFTSKTTTTLPRFIGTVVKLGRKRFGDHQFAVGYSTLEVDRDHLGEGFTQIEAMGSVDLNLNSNYRNRWYGMSFAAQVAQKVSIGLSAFVAQQRYDYGEDIGLASGGVLSDNGLRVGGDSVTTTTRLSVTSYDVLFRLGALYRINSRWQLGFMFQPPGFQVSNKGSVFNRTTAAVSGGDTGYFLFDEGDLSTRAPVPLELRVGFEFKATATTVLSVDASVDGPVRNQNVFNRPEELENVDRSLGVYFANSTARRWTPNVAVGAEHLFGKVAVAGGLFTNISAAPDVPATATEYTPDQVNMFGASISVGVDTKGYRLSVGAT
ncbi:MAG: outer membrane protein transport protein, partial [Deltaproteobacteria bacterium]|nr:outer membrane protein transport protein [Deltaproteobacteria bacterium]